MTPKEDLDLLKIIDFATSIEECPDGAPRLGDPRNIRHHA